MSPWRLNIGLHLTDMKIRRGISPFIATVILVAITLTLGGVLYSQFRQVVSSEVRNPSVSISDVNVASDRQTITLLLKNDGNVDFTVTKILFSYLSTNQRFTVGGNATVISGSPALSPGGLLALRFTVSGVSLPDLASFTITVVSDQLARAFTVQA